MLCSLRYDVNVLRIDIAESDTVMSATEQSKNEKNQKISRKTIKSWTVFVHGYILLKYFYT